MSAAGIAGLVLGAAFVLAVVFAAGIVVGVEMVAEANRLHDAEERLQQGYPPPGGWKESGGSR